MLLNNTVSPVVTLEVVHQNELSLVIDKDTVELSWTDNYHVAIMKTRYREIYHCKGRKV